MTVKSWVWVLLASAVLVGCGDKSSKKKSSSDETEEEEKSEKKKKTKDQAKEKPVLAGLETFKAPDKPKDSFDDPWDLGANRPPTPTDALAADCLTILKIDFKEEPADEKKIPKDTFAKIIKFYVDTPYAKIRGYRPWFHKHFIDSLKEPERARLVDELTAYVAKNGVNDPRK